MHQETTSAIADTLTYYVTAAAVVEDGGV